MKTSSISEIIFSLMLFLMFVIGGFLMVSYSGNIYKHIIDNGNTRESVSIPLAYISKKCNQAKSKDYVSIESIEGLDVLVINNDSYLTCIYSNDNYLKELNISDLNKFNKNDGTNIYKIDKLEMNYDNDLYEFKIENNNASDSLTLALR